MILWFSVPLWTGYGYMKLSPSPPCGYEYQLHDLIPRKWSYTVQNFTVGSDMNKSLLITYHENYYVKKYISK